VLLGVWVVWWLRGVLWRRVPECVGLLWLAGAWTIDGECHGDTDAEPVCQCDDDDNINFDRIIVGFRVGISVGISVCISVCIKVCIDVGNSDGIGVGIGIVVGVHVPVRLVEYVRLRVQECVTNRNRNVVKVCHAREQW
jgi:hypothetical protein